MSKAAEFAALFDGKQVASKDEADYTKKQLEEPVDPPRWVKIRRPIPKRGPCAHTAGPALKRKSMRQLLHDAMYGKP